MSFMLPNNPTPQAVLNLPLPDGNDAGAKTVKDYLVRLLHALWREGEGFSGKRPFGNSSWEWDLYQPLVDAGFMKENDRKTGNKLISEAIDALGSPSSVIVTSSESFIEEK